MAGSTEWFSDPATLLEEVQRGGRDRHQPLEIPGYGDLHELRRGGQGVVYRGVQVSTKRPVAVKVLLDGAFASASNRRRFEREIDIIAGLRHPSIVSIYDSGTTSDNRLYFVMEFVDGRPLDEYVRACRDTAPNAASHQRRLLELFADVCDAVQFAHQNGVIHRDLKPSNIRIDAAGHPRVLDFGLAKSVDSGERSAATLSGAFLGSLAWASPEQAEGDSSRIDVRSDIYSLGVVIYDLLTGDFPCDVTGSVREVLDRIVNVDPERPSTVGRSAPGDRTVIDDDLDTIVLKCLAKDPDRRYQTALDLARDVRRHLSGEPIEARRDSTWYVLSKNLRRYKLVASVAGAFFVLALGFAVVMVVLFNRAVSAEQLAERRLVRAQDEADKKTAVNSFLDDMLLSVDAERNGYEVKVADVLHRGAGEIERQFADHPEIRASLLDTIGTSFYSLGRYEEAARLLSRGVALQRELSGDSDAATLDLMGKLAVAQLYAGAVDEADRTITETVRLADETLGPHHPTTLASRANLALVRHGQGRLAEAVDLAGAALAGQRRALGDDHRDTLTTLRSLGGLLREQGELATAEAILLEAYQCCERAFGPEHPDTLTAANNLALLLDQQGQWDRAEVLFDQIVQTQERLRGGEHPETLTALNNLGHVIQAQGRFDEAVVIYRRVLAARRRVLGTDHSLTLLSMNNLARVLHDQGELEEALPLLREAYETMERVEGRDHPHTLNALGALAGVLADTGELDQAEALFSQALELQRAALGENHPSTLIAMNNLAGVRRDQGRHAEALAQYDLLLERAPGVLPAGHWFVELCRSSSGFCLIKLGRFDEAEARLVEAHAALLASLGADHVRTLLTAARLVELYESWGRPEQAAAFRVQPASDETDRADTNAPSGG